MANFDYSIVPAVVTITNVATAEEAFDAGTKPVEIEIPKTDLKPGEEYTPIEGDEDNVIVKRKYITGARRLQFFKTNSYCILEPADELKLVARTSAELNYFMSLNDGENFKVTAEKQSA